MTDWNTSTTRRPSTTRTAAVARFHLLSANFFPSPCRRNTEQSNFFSK